MARLVSHSPASRYVSRCLPLSRTDEMGLTSTTCPMFERTSLNEDGTSNANGPGCEIDAVRADAGAWEDHVVVARGIGHVN